MKIKSKLIILSATLVTFSCAMPKISHAEEGGFDILVEGDQTKENSEDETANELRNPNADVYDVQVEHYEQEVDPFTGIPYTEETVSDADEITISKNCIYEKKDDRYKIVVTDKADSFVYTSVTSGMIVNTPVNIEVGSSLKYKLYRNGEETEDIDLANIDRIGNYVLKVFDNSSMEYEPLEFTIVGSNTGMIKRYDMPAGFIIDSVNYNNEDINFNKSYVDLQQDGKYIIDYECKRTGLSYQLSVNIDHVAPVLKLENVVNGKAKGAVDISDVEDEATITIVYDGKQIDYKKKLTKSGDYEITISDKAGNASKYKFRIMVYFDKNSWAVTIGVVLIIFGVAAYIIISRNKMRVR